MAVTRRQHLITTEAWPGTCRKCHRGVIAGVSEGLTVRVDPARCGLLDQAVAVVTGRLTYTLINRTLVQRVDRWSHWPVLAEHRCGWPLGTMATMAPATNQDQPPF